MKFTIHWKSLITGYEGQGTGLLPQNVGKRLVDHLNHQYDGKIKHWLVLEEK